jgi:hypothetical protein
MMFMWCMPWSSRPYLGFSISQVLCVGLMLFTCYYTLMLTFLLKHLHISALVKIVWGTYTHVLLCKCTNYIFNLVLCVSDSWLIVHILSHGLNTYFIDAYVLNLWFNNSCFSIISSTSHISYVMSWMIYTWASPRLVILWFRAHTYMVDISCSCLRSISHFSSIIHVNGSWSMV